MDKTKADDLIANAVYRSGPRHRPRLGTELEDRLAETEARAAAQYASMESKTDELNRIADEIELANDDALQVGAPEDATAVPRAVDFEDSLVQNIEEVRAHLIRDLIIKKKAE